MQGRYILCAFKRKTRQLSCKTCPNLKKKKKGLRDQGGYHTPWLRNQGRERVLYDSSCQVSSCVFPFSSSSGHPQSGNGFMYFLTGFSGRLHARAKIAPQRSRRTLACLLHGPRFARTAGNVLKNTYMPLRLLSCASLLTLLCETVTWHAPLLQSLLCPTCSTIQTVVLLLKRMDTQPNNLRWLQNVEGCFLNKDCQLLNCCQDGQTFELRAL